jgi:hypothetical protein
MVPVILLQPPQRQSPVDVYGGNLDLKEQGEFARDEHMQA